MAFRIDTLTLNGFRSLRETTVRLGDVNVVIGVNGAGKSNFEDGLELLRAIASRKFQEFVGRRGGAHRLLHRGAPRPEELWVEVGMGTTSYVAQLGFAEVDALVFLSEGFTIGNTMEAKALAAQKDGPFSSHGHAESVLGIYEGAEQDAVRAFADGLAAIRRWHFADTSSQSPLRQRAHINDNRELHATGANLASVLYLLKKRHRAQFGLIVSTLKLVAPFVEELVIEPLNLSPDFVLIQWRQGGVEGLFDVGHLSDGTLRFLALATVLLQPNPPPIVVLDEPELGLHPHALVILVELLRQAARRTQLVVATQSRQVVDLVDIAHVIVAERVDGETVLRRPDPAALAKWLDDYSLGELWDMNVLGSTGPDAG